MKKVLYLCITALFLAYVGHVLQFENNRSRPQQVDQSNWAKFAGLFE